MMLWLLERRADSERWEPAYDKAHGFVVRAESEDKAREMVAMSNSVGDEGRDAWLNADHTTCAPLLVDGAPEIVLCDFYAA